MRHAIRRAAAFVALSPLALLAQSVKQTSGDPIPSGGDGTIYVGTYARNILVLDEATMSVRDTLRTTVGIPEISAERSTNTNSGPPNISTPMVSRPHWPAHSSRTSLAPQKSAT